MAAQRTFVATSGNDANGCTLAAPCRAFAKALTVTDPGGEIVVLDSGGYGAVTVNKNVTIQAPAGVYAGVSVSAGDGITVAAPATKVVLRGLTVNGLGGANGVRVQSGEVHIEGMVISNMTAAGVLVEGGSTVRLSGVTARTNADGLRVAPGAGTTTVLVRDSEFSNNAVTGVAVAPSAAGAVARVTLERSSVTKNGAGVATAPGASATGAVVLTQTVASDNAGAGVSASGSTASVFVRESTITRNGTGLLQASAGVLTACGANLLVGNTTPQSGSIILNAAACLDQIAGGTVTSVATGAGLTGGPITTAGTVNLAATNLLPTTACAAGQVAKWNGSAWVCAADNNAGGTVTSVTAGAGLIGGTITSTGTIAVDPASPTLTGNYFRLGGNAFGATTALGTKDANELDLVVNNLALLRLQPGGGGGPNVIAGHPGNGAVAFFNGQTVSGGGRDGTNCWNPITNDFTRVCANVVNNNFATVGGGIGNSSGGDSATVGGGSANAAGGDDSTIGGGFNNVASAKNATIGGGEANRANGQYATIAGGVANTAAAEGDTVGGGSSNIAQGDPSWVPYVGAEENGTHATVSGGGRNRAEKAGTVAGGWYNEATGGMSAVGGGYANRASGAYAAVPGGVGNLASGYASVAMGFRATADRDHCMVFSAWADGVGGYLNCFGWSNVIRFGAEHGVSFDFGPRRQFDGGGQNWIAFGDTVDILNMINTSSGARLTVGGVWTDSSDRNRKHRFHAVDGESVLRRVAALPISTWSFVEEPDRIRHMGAMAQDFHAVFGLGEDDKHISALDTGGVALAAIQGLYRVVQDKDATIVVQTRKLARQEHEIEVLKDRLAQLESLRAELAAVRAAVATLTPRTRVAATSPRSDPESRTRP